MNRVDHDIEIAKNVISGNDFYGYFCGFSHIYPFTTENIKGYMDNIQFKNDGNYLVPCSSSDHLLNIASAGSKNIDTFDISIFPKYYMYLKLAALKVLECEEFKSYLLAGYSKDDNDLFNIKFYEEIRSVISCLDKDSLKFWDSLYNFEKGRNIMKSKLFSDGCGKGFTLNNNNYIIEKNYNKLKDNIDDLNITYTNCDVGELPDLLEKKYNGIFLSNINDYSDLTFHYYEKGKYFHSEFYDELVGKDLARFLSDDDSIIINYIYGKKYNKRVKNSNFYYYSIPSYNGKNNLKQCDSVLVYKKKY